ncbi:MAG: hypothetical protein ACOCUT_00035 [bacterium]
MSFRCEKCNVSQSPKTQPIQTVTKERKVRYPQRLNEDNEIIDNGGTGFEIAEQLNLCEKCAKKVGPPIIIN